jgi:parallel beta-helix repeat protein
MRKWNSKWNAKHPWNGAPAALLTALALTGLGPALAGAAPCGDGAGPEGSRVACACGDSVVTSTVLQPGDPVANAVCAGDGLVVGADEIRLDCRGLILTGDGSGYGVRLDDRHGAVVARCGLSDFLIGVRLQGSDGNRIAWNAVRRSQTDGIALESSHRNRILGNGVVGSGESGIDLSGSKGNLVSSNKVARSGQSGIELGQESDHNTVAGNLSRDNDGQGLRLSDHSLENVVRRNWLARNGSHGLLVSGGSGQNEITSNVVRGNQGDGLRLLSGDGNVVYTMLAARNSGDGICVASTGNRVVASFSSHNGSDGFQAEASASENAYAWNASYANASYGFRDGSVGAGVAGTANKYGANRCAENGSGSSDPQGLCVGD